MIIAKSLKSVALLVMTVFASTPSQAQDLLARQAPVDRKMKAVDSIVLNRLIEQECMKTQQVTCMMSGTMS